MAAWTGQRSGPVALLDDEAPRREVLTDGELGPGELTLDFADRLAELGPWGQRHPEPLFEGAFEVLDQRVVGGAHLLVAPGERLSPGAQGCLEVALLEEEQALAVLEAAEWTRFVGDGADVSLKPNLGWDKPLPGAISAPWVVEGVILALSTIFANDGWA